jgi:hypothetical protein
VGGGGLLSGIGTVVRAKRPDVELIGVEPVHAACFTAALAAATPVTVPLAPTLADGLAVAQLGTSPSRSLRSVVDGRHRRRGDIALAILRLIELEKSVVEGAGAAPLAAFLAGKLDELKGSASCWRCAAATSISRCSTASSRSGSWPTAADAVHRIDQRPARRPRAPRRDDRFHRRIDQGNRARPRVLRARLVGSARHLRRGDDRPRPCGRAARRARGGGHVGGRLAPREERSNGSIRAEREH